MDENKNFSSTPPNHSPFGRGKTIGKSIHYTSHRIKMCACDITCVAVCVFSVRAMADDDNSNCWKREREKKIVNKMLFWSANQINLLLCRLLYCCCLPAFEFNAIPKAQTSKHLTPINYNFLFQVFAFAVHIFVNTPIVCIRIWLHPLALADAKCGVFYDFFDVLHGDWWDQFKIQQKRNVCVVYTAYTKQMIMERKKKKKKSPRYNW